MHLDGIDLLGGQQSAVGAGVTRLAPGAAPARGTRGSFGGRGRVGGRRAGGVAGVLIEAGGQLGHLGLQGLPFC